MNETISYYLSFLKKINKFRERKTAKIVRGVFNWYKSRWPESYAKFEKNWLQPRLVNLPNLLSFSRVVLLIPLASVMVCHEFCSKWPALIIALIIGLTDFFDGPIAREEKCVTDNGSLIDPFADKIFFCLIIILSQFYYQIQLWWLLIILAIFGEVVYSAIRIYKVIHKIKPFSSNFLGRSKFFLQIVVIYALLFPYASISWQLMLNLTLLTSAILLYLNIFQELQKLFLKNE